MRWVVRGGYGISQYMEGTGANLRLPLNPPFFFESAVHYDVTTGPGTLATGFAELKPLDQPSGQVRAWDPNLRPQFTQQWNVFVERLLTNSMSANVGYVGHKATHLVTPVEGNQPLPGVGSDTTTWLPAQQRRPLYATAPLITNISTTAARGRSDYNGLQMSLRQRNVKGVEYLASYTLSRTRTNNLGYYGSGGVQAEGAYWMNTYEPEWNYGPAFFDARHNFVFSANYELPFGSGRKWAGNASGARRRDHRRLAVERHLPGARRDSRSRSPTAARVRCRGSAATSGRTASAIRCRPIRTSTTGSTSTPSQCVPLGTWGNCPHRRRAGARLQEHRRRAGQAVQRRRQALLRVPGRGVQPDQHAELRSAGARHQRAEHVRHDHEHGQHRADGGDGVEVLLLTVHQVQAGSARFSAAISGTWNAVERF